MRIDPHEHLRDREEAHKETIAHGLELATQQGVDVVFDMPNKKRPIISEPDVIDILELVPNDQHQRYFLYMGVTADPEQIKEAIECYGQRHFSHRIVGLKMFAGRSVGPLAVTTHTEQYQVYQTLTKLGYKGVLAAHCEKEDLMKPELWNRANPISHSWSRPKEAEIESIQDQIKFAIETGFAGTLHICHVSCPESVDVINNARGKIKITCGVTPHYLMWANEFMKKEANGLIYKVNPPLRVWPVVEGLRRCLQAGLIDWVETDHAPHAIGEKLFSQDPPSGIPSLYLYRDFVERFLPEDLGLSPEQIQALTCDNIIKAFGDKLSSLQSRFPT
ncbi:MAG TPA: dihydroorotase [Patescibacteria group bacterium]|nr:dihydroorotase [Patescibacteria group bacterium]